MDQWQIVTRIARGVYRRRKRLVGLTFVIAAVLLCPLAYYLSREPPRFRTSATILLEARPDRVPVFQEFSPYRPLPVQLAILQSRSLAEAVVDNLPKASLQDLVENPYHVDYLQVIKNFYLRWRGREPEVESPQRRALTELQKARVVFDTSKGNGIVDVIALASKPQVAIDIVNTYIEVLLGRTRSFNVDDARLSREFLEQQLADVKRNLRSAEESLRNFTAAHGGIKIPERAQTTTGQLAQTENALAEVETNRKMLETRLRGLREKLESQKNAPPVPGLAPAPPPRTAPAVHRLRAQLAQLESGLLELKTRYTDEHPRVAQLREQIAEVQRQLGDQVKSNSATPLPTAGPPADRVNFAEHVVTLETSLHALIAQEEALRKKGEELRQGLTGLSRSELEYTRLVRDVQSNQTLHAMLADKLTAARIREQGEMKVVKIIDPAGHPQPATSEKRVRFFTFALAMALATGVGVPAAVEWFHKKVETEEDVYTYTGLPMLAMIPRVRSGQPVFVDATRGEDLERLGETLIFTEAFRSLRVALQLASRTEPFRTFVVVSPFAGEGKSTTVVNLGFAFREAGIRVVIADTDLARPTLAQTMKVEPTGELVRAIHAGVGIQETLVEVGEGMWLAAQAKTTQPGHRGTLATARVKEFVGGLAERADIVLFDSSPILLIQDSLFLAAAVDAVILVAKAGSTACRDLARAKAMLDSVGARTIGAVINEMPGRVLKSYYTQYYNAYVRPRGKSSRRRRLRA